jgi:phosphohistidine phosphatase SixA
VQRTGPRIGHLLVVAHNPGVSELMHDLLPQGSAAHWHGGAVLDRL